MEKKTASEETIQSIYKNLGENINNSSPILNHCVNTFNKISQTDYSQINDEDIKTKFFMWKGLLNIQLIVLYCNIEMATSLRANFRSIELNEKRYNLKYISVITLEGYKYLLSFGKSKSKSVWREIRKLANQLNNQDLQDECISIEKELEAFGDKETNKGLRDIAVHYNKNPLEVYNSLMKISEDEEARRTSAFMSILERLSIFINKYIQEYQIPLYIPTLPIPDTSLWEKINQFIDKENNLYITLGETIERWTKGLERFAKLQNFPNKINELLKLDEPSMNQVNNLFKAFQPSMHILYLYLDLACAIRAYLKSECYIEKQLNLRRINVITHEGFKLLYGYTEEEYTESFWNKNIAPIIKESSDIESIAQLNNLEIILKELSKSDAINNPSLRNISIHYRDKEINNIPLIFNVLIRLNPIIEMAKSLKLLKILPLLFKVMQSALSVANKDMEAKRRQSWNETTMKVDSFITFVQNSKVEDSKKQDVIKMLNQIKSLPEKIKNKI